MPSVERVLGELTGALTGVREFRRCLQVGADLWADAVELLRSALTGSRDPEVESFLAWCSDVQRRFDERSRATAATECGIQSIINRLRGDGPSDPTPTSPTRRAATPRPVVSPSGDHYPERAAWAAHLVDQPYSPIKSGVPVVGIARVAGTDRTFTFRPGSGRWTEVAATRLAQLGAPNWVRALDLHIEFQVAAWMVDSGYEDVELVINRESCGERFGRGCHQAIRSFLPRGSRMSVSGTRGGGQHFTYDYEGKARE